MKLKTKMLVAASATMLTLGAGAATLASASDRSGWFSQRAHFAGDRGCRHGGGMKKMAKAKQFLKRYDANGDSKLSQQEIDTVRKELFIKYDADKNGTLSLAEFQPLWLDLRNMRMVRAYQRLDQDGNAEITEVEFIEPLSQLVQYMDRNGDGFLSIEDRKRRGGKRGGSKPQQ